MNRSDFQILAEQRLKEARQLSAAGSWPGAYYLAGYAIECALKACIAKRTRAFDFPDKKLTEASYTHDLQKLVAAAALAQELKTHADSNVDFAANWETVKEWSEQARYDLALETKAVDMVDAVGNEGNGVLSWLSTHW